MPRKSFEEISAVVDPENPLLTAEQLRNLHRLRDIPAAELLGRRHRVSHEDSNPGEFEKSQL